MGYGDETRVPYEAHSRRSGQVTEYARWYYLSKCFYFGHVIWYDWQLFYAFPQLCAAPAPIKPGILHECALSMR